MPLKQIVGAAIVDDLENPGLLLAARRTRPEEFAGLWEFPGGKVDPGEACETALVRELNEELGIESTLGTEVSGPIEQGWKLAGPAAMRVWFARIDAGFPLPLEDHDLLRWIPLEGASSALDWIPADLPIVDAVTAAAQSQHS
ncbi:(deoxy)nucleoside triphosphate pyrophosphohydrolase [Zhihengliuella salsuginis]|uniref:8-oxo-dGTP diphosphatase n=1 Tax=Zhihengliuella salsuginis TaxID=578222 RepID=A0ABQ3GJZ6_9MICC|nr:NUDIX domain-containing protein [Zhihengliuella salsuginis]GHD07197.1 DNA mismatch repair protein MutT [Zhihengliuella salsuginis]